MVRACSLRFGASYVVALARLFLRSWRLASICPAIAACICLSVSVAKSSVFCKIPRVDIDAIASEECRLTLGSCEMSLMASMSPSASCRSVSMSLYSSEQSSQRTEIGGFRMLSPAPRCTACALKHVSSQTCAIWDSDLNVLFCLLILMLSPHWISTRTTCSAWVDVSQQRGGRLEYQK